MVATYLDNGPDPETFGFLRHDFDELESRFGGVIGTSFRTFPSYPQRFIESLASQPDCDASLAGVQVEKLRPYQQPTEYTQDDLCIRQFMRGTSRRLVPDGHVRAA
jgi:hypothetical protein